MSKILIKNKEIVVPGEIVAEGMDYLPTKGIIREDEKLIATQIGLISIEGRLIKLIQLVGPYQPKKNDLVIGKVENITMSGWMIDINYNNLSMLPLRDASSDYIERNADLTQYFNYGDILIAKISNISSAGIDLTMKGPGLTKLQEGIIIDITPSKIPRVIGKQGSMINLIKDKTNCKILAAQNGKVWVKGLTLASERKAISSIRLVEKESHTEGLTQRIEKFLGVK